MPDSQHTIAGTVLTMPVRIRKADVHTAMFSVDAAAASTENIAVCTSALRICTGMVSTVPAMVCCEFGMPVTVIR